MWRKRYGFFADCPALIELKRVYNRIDAESLQQYQGFYPPRSSERFCAAPLRLVHLWDGKVFLHLRGRIRLDVDRYPRRPSQKFFLTRMMHSCRKWKPQISAISGSRRIRKPASSGIAATCERLDTKRPGKHRRYGFWADGLCIGEKRGFISRVPRPESAC